MIDDYDCVEIFCTKCVLLKSLERNINQIYKLIAFIKDRVIYIYIYIVSYQGNGVCIRIV